MSFTNLCVFYSPPIRTHSRETWPCKGYETGPCWYSFLKRCAVRTLFLKMWQKFTVHSVH